MGGPSLHMIKIKVPPPLGYSLVVRANFYIVADKLSGFSTK